MTFNMHCILNARFNLFFLNFVPARVLEWAGMVCCCYFILSYVVVYHCVSVRESEYVKHDRYDGYMYTDEFNDNDDFDDGDVLL